MDNRLKKKKSKIINRNKSIGNEEKKEVRRPYRVPC